MSKPTWCGECGGYHGDQQNEDPCACNPPDKKTATELAIEQDPRTKLSEALGALQAILSAIKRAEREGCINHLDACDDAGQFFSDAESAAEAILRKHGRVS